LSCLGATFRTCRPAPRLCIRVAAFCLAGLLLISLPLTISAQTTSQSTAAAPASSTATLHVKSQLVVVDVTITDSSGNPVQGLPRSAFRITESGKPQTISSFEEHNGITAAKISAPAPAPKPGVFTNTVTSTGESVANVVLLDLLNTPMQNQAFVRKQLLDYVKTAKPGAPIAVFGLTSRLLMLQPFTSDPDLLRRAVERTRPEASPLLKNKLGGGQDIVAAQIADIEAQLSVSPEIADALQAFNDADTQVTDAQLAGATLHAMHQLALYLAGIPGRKNLIWFSNAFPLNLMPHGSAMAVPFVGESSWEVEYRETVNLFARSRVAVYPVDARGLDISPGGNTVFEAHQTMQQVAEDTGGKAFINTNGLAQAVETVVDSGSNFYTLTYAPTNSNSHDDFRSIHVDLSKNSGLKLSYRRGYYADTGATASTSTLRETVQTATAYFAPPATQVPFYARVLPIPANAPDIVAPGEAPHPRRVLDSAHMLRYSVEYSTDVLNLSILSAPDGKRMAHVEYMALVYDAQGKRVNSAVKSLHEIWTPAQFPTTQQRGVRYQQQIDVPARGEFTIRLLVHDLTTDRIGSIDIPLSTLPPAPSASPIATAQPPIPHQPLLRVPHP